MSGIPVWYIPSWHGDLRLKAVARDATCIKLHEPTSNEREVADLVLAKARELGWVSGDPSTTHFRGGEDTIVLGAELGKVGPMVTGIVRPSEGVLTAITFMSDRVITVENARANLGDVVKSIEAETRAVMERVAAEEAAGPTPPAPAPPVAPAVSTPALAQPAPPASAAPAPKAREAALANVTPKAAVTVRRPTPCCPQCTRGAVGPASEVLLAFLDEQQHKDWSERRAIIVRGGLTGNRYLLAHRNTDLAAQIGRICFDMDGDVVVHFHDRTVPPEEEVLAAKLILEHREPWLRNEATYFVRGGPRRSRFKNPFGDGLDGVADASLTQLIGSLTSGGRDVHRAAEMLYQQAVCAINQAVVDPP